MKRCPLLVKILKSVVKIQIFPGLVGALKQLLWNTCMYFSNSTVILYCLLLNKSFCLASIQNRFCRFPKDFSENNPNLTFNAAPDILKLILNIHALFEVLVRWSALIVSREVQSLRSGQRRYCCAVFLPQGGAAMPKKQSAGPGSLTQ